MKDSLGSNKGSYSRQQFTAAPRGRRRQICRRPNQISLRCAALRYSAVCSAVSMSLPRRASLCSCQPLPMFWRHCLLLWGEIYSDDESGYHTYIYESDFQRCLGEIRIPKGLKCLCRLLRMHALVSRHLQDFPASIQVSESIFSLCTTLLQT